MHDVRVYTESMYAKNIPALIEKKKEEKKATQLTKMTNEN